MAGWTLGRSRSGTVLKEGVLDDDSPVLAEAPIDLNRQPVFCVSLDESADKQDIAFVRQEIEIAKDDLLKPLTLRFLIYSSAESEFRLHLNLNSREPAERISVNSVKKTVKGWDYIEVPAVIEPKQVARSDKLYLVAQLNGLLEPGEMVALAQADLRIPPSVDGRRLSFRFDTFGDYQKASARLRGHKLIQTLREAGHTVTVNEGDGCDIYVCQKVRPFDRIRKWKGRRPLVVFDFDDNYFLKERGSDASLYAFMNNADMVTVGSEALLEQVQYYHPNTFLLENPADIISDQVSRAATASLDRVGWFGAPENLRYLELLPPEVPVTTITRGGDIEFDIYEVDRQLTQFDLLVFPLPIDDWTASKNANRMVKAVALGVPVLASATEEHIKAAKLLGLDDRFLVAADEDWSTKIAQLRADFGPVQEAILAARDEALRLYSTEAILDHWLERVYGLRSRDGEVPRALPTPLLTDASSLKSVDVIIDDIQSDTRFRDTTQRSEVDWNRFGSKHLLSLLPPDNGAFETSSFQYHFAGDDVENAFRAMERIIQTSTAEYILYIPAGYRLMYGFERIAQQQMSGDASMNIVVFGSSEPATNADEMATNIDAVRVGFWNPRIPGVMLLRRSWLASQPLTPWRMLTYWPWAISASAIIGGRNEDAVRLVSAVCTQRLRARTIDNASAIHARFIEATWPRNRTYSLPSATDQWARISFEIIEMFAREHPAALPWILASGFQYSLRQTWEIDRLKRELARATTKK